MNDPANRFTVTGITCASESVVTLIANSSLFVAVRPSTKIESLVAFAERVKSSSAVAWATIFVLLILLPKIIVLFVFIIFNVPLKVAF